MRRPAKVLWDLVQSASVCTAVVKRVRYIRVEKIGKRGDYLGNGPMIVCRAIFEWRVGGLGTGSASKQVDSVCSR